MSASREKKARQERGADYLNPQQQKAMAEQNSARRTTIIFAVCAVVLVVAVAAMLLYNSGIFQRGAAAVSVNGKTYTAGDIAYYYYNGRANLAGRGSVDSSTSLREQDYSGDDDAYTGRTWYDYLADQALQSLANAELTAQAAKDAGFDGGSDVEASVNDTIASLESSAVSYGYSTADYLRALFGSLMTRGVFERNLRTVALADAYTAFKSDVSGYTDAELSAVADADPNSYAMVDYEYAVFPSSNYATSADEAANTEADDGSEAALAAAEDALARFRAGEALEAIANDEDVDYARTRAYYGSAEILEWLFDDARKDGDADVFDYTYYGVSLGSMAVVFHGKERADFHAVDIRHILVDDEATANDVLAQFNAGDRSEDSFAALAREYSSDGNASDGGIYTGVYLGQMVAPFEDWCFDPARRPGDTGIVETSYGYHVMYFIDAHSAAYWQEAAASKLASDWVDSLSANVATELLGGMKYIDP